MDATAAQSFSEPELTRKHRQGRRNFAHRTLCLALALAFVSMRSAAAAPITLDVQRHGDGVDIHASALVHADEPATWRVLTDYRRYSEFIPGVRRSDIVRRNGAWVTVRQSLTAPLWLLHVPVDITYRIFEAPPGRLYSRGMAEHTLVESTYTVTTVPVGVRLDYVGRIVPAGAFRFIERAAGERAVADEFQALVTEIERQYRAAQ
jgi:hypothetical protein